MPITPLIIEHMQPKCPVSLISFLLNLQADGKIWVITGGK